MICKCLVYAAALLNVVHAAYSGIQSFGPLTAAFASQQQQQQQQTVPPSDIPPGLTHLALSQLAAAQQQDPNAYHAQAAAAQFQRVAPQSLSSFQFASAGSPGSGTAAQFQSAGGAAQYFGAGFPAAQSAGSPSSGTAAQFQSAGLTGGAAQYFGANLPAAQSVESPNSGTAAQYYGTSLPAAQSADTDEPEQQQQQQQQPQRLSRPGAYFTRTAQYQPAQLKQSDTPTKAASANLLGVAFSPASEVSQLRFSGFGANYSY
uniref:(California timema) hypothetical protein n=1 Tax=Timema californicum TaxID=61474 RepID=A0A7R9IZD9_TIMCA|nr:unnamed protein product [Timema californicum]